LKNDIEKHLATIIDMAKRARLKGIDPETEPEVMVVHSRAELMQLLMPKLNGFGLRADELISHLGPDLAGFKIAEETILGKFGYFSDEEKILLAIRAGLITMNQGYDDSALFSISNVRISSQPQKALIVNYNSFVFKVKSFDLARSVIIADYIRRNEHLSAYKFSNEDFANLYNGALRIQKFAHIVKEVMNHLQIGVFSDDGPDVIIRVLLSIIKHKNKLLKLARSLNLEGWSWLEVLSFMRSPRYIELPLSQYGKGGFKIRYGRAHNTGFGAIGIHPATMVLLNGLIRPGSYLKINIAPWHVIAVPVDTINGPIVELRDGSIVEIKNLNDIFRISEQIVRILHLGDILISYNDLVNFNTRLKRAGFCDEWWRLLLIRRLKENDNVKNIIRALGFSDEILNHIIQGNIMPNNVQAIEFSKKLGLPLHPQYTFNWDALSVDDFLQLRRLLQSSKLTFQNDKLVLRSVPEIKRLFKKLLVPYNSSNGFLEVENAIVLLLCLNLDSNVDLEKIRWMSINDIIYSISGITIMPRFVNNVSLSLIIKKQKAESLGHIVIPFNVDDLTTVNDNNINVELPVRICSICNEITYKYQCPKCGARTIKGYHCLRCGSYTDSITCPHCGSRTEPYDLFNINAEEYHKAIRNIGLGAPNVLKPVKNSKGYEIIEKGILRAFNEVLVSNDGVIKVQLTNAPLTQFKPKDVNVDIKILKSLGYNYDVDGNPLQNDEQIVNLLPYDVILPKYVGEIFLRVAKFVDAELQKLYKLPPFYYISDLHELIGHLIIGFAPNSRIGIIGRIIGFTNSDILYANPSWHSSKGRKCNGHKDYIVLALDLVLNYSSSYLGLNNRPFIINTNINEVKMIDEPITIYDTAWTEEQINAVLLPKELSKYNKFMMHSPFLNNPVLHTSEDQNILSIIEKYLNILPKLEYIDAEKNLLMLSEQLLPILKKNLLSYLTSGFTCIKCGSFYKRPPLSGVCIKCNSDLKPIFDTKELAQYVTIFDKISSVIKKQPNILQNIVNLIHDIVKEVGVEERLDRFL
jgi:DNA polymerase II large subunit